MVEGERVAAVSIPFRHASDEDDDVDDVCETDGGEGRKEGVKFCGSLLRPHSVLADAAN